MPHSRRTITYLPRYQKKKWGTKKDKTNATYEITDAKTKNFKRGQNTSYFYVFKHTFVPNGFFQWQLVHTMRSQIEVYAVCKIEIR